MDELDFIETLIEDVRPHVVSKYAQRADLDVSTKTGPNDLLTEVDLYVQEQITRKINERFKDDAIVAEEMGLSARPADPPPRCWVIDPIDGTQNFVKGIFPIFGISIAFVENGDVVAAGVDIPLAGRLFLARRGQGATCNGTPLRVSGTESIGVARVEVDFANPDMRDETLARFSDIVRRAGQFRCNCAAVVGICSVASGDGDAYVHVGLNPWDSAAATLAVQEAGGIVTHRDGSPYGVFDADGSVVATNGVFHDECLALIDNR